MMPILYDIVYMRFGGRLRGRAWRMGIAAAGGGATCNRCGGAVAVGNIGELCCCWRPRAYRKINEN